MDPTSRLRTLYVIIGVPLGRDSDEDSGNVLVNCDWSTCTTYSPCWAANRQLRPNDIALQRTFDSNEPDLKNVRSIRLVIFSTLSLQ